LFVFYLELQHGAFAKRFFSKGAPRFFLPAITSNIVDFLDPLGPMITIIDLGSANLAKKDLIFFATNQSNFHIIVYEISKQS
jgi:hypothetical protein